MSLELDIVEADNVLIKLKPFSADLGQYIFQVVTHELKTKLNP